MTVNVGEGTLEELQAQFTNAARLLRDIDVVGPFDRLATPLPGSDTASAASLVGVRLAAATLVVAERADGLAEAVRGAAESYTATDTDVAGRLQGVQWPR